MNEEPAHEIPTAPRSRKKFFIFVAVLLIAIIAGSFFIASLQREPSYNGKPLTYWLQQYQSVQWIDATDPKQIESREAIRHIGTNAIPALLRKLQARDSAVKTKMMEWNDEHDFLHLHFVPAEEQNALAVVGFRALGELATNAIPTLIDIHNHNYSPASRECANTSLIWMYPAAGVTNPYWRPANQRAEWFLGAGQMRISSGDHSNAALAFSEALKLEPTNTEAYISRASARIQLRDWTGALADAQKTLEFDPKEESAVYIEGVCKFYTKDFKGAETDLTSVINLNTNNIAAYNSRGLARANLRKMDEALTDFDKAIEVNPSDPPAYRNRAMIESLQKEYEVALDDLAKAIDRDAKDPLAYATRGRIKSSLKDYEGALVDLDEAIALNPKDPLNYASRAAANMYLDDFTKTEVDLEKALALGPKTGTAYVVRGVLKAKRDEDDEAVADLEHAVELSPQSPETIAVLGLFQYKAGRLAAALENCRKALELKPLAHTTDLRAYIWLIRAQRGEVKEASAELETYLKMPQPGKTNAWEVSVAQYLSGNLAESNFLSQATTTARRPSEINDQVCESLYYAGMKHKLAGDKPGAMGFFRRCLGTKNHNDLGYMNAGVEMGKLKKGN